MEAGHEYVVRLGDRTDPDGSIPFASAKELVRCKNCRYWNNEETTCWYHNMLTGSKFYCERAEKKAGEQDDKR